MKNFINNKELQDVIRNNTQIKKRTFILLILSFIILNFFVASFLNVRHLKTSLRNHYFITADFKKDVKKETKELAEKDILKIESVKKVEYRSRYEAFRDLQYTLDISIPNSDNPLYDSMLVYFDSPQDISNIQTKLEDMGVFKETFVDKSYISELELRSNFYSTLSILLILLGIVPMMFMIYFIHYTAISIDYVNNKEIIRNDNKNRRRSKRINDLPLIASNILGTLTFLNVYLYFKNHLLMVGGHFVILDIREMIFWQIVIVAVINFILLVIPIRIKLEGEL